MGHVLKAATEEAEELARHHFAAERREGTASMARCRWGGEGMAEKPLKNCSKIVPSKKMEGFVGRLGFLGGFWTFSWFIVGFGVSRF